MAQRILIGFDDSENALRAVEYIAESFSNQSHVTLFNVSLDTAALCEMESPELSPYFKSHQSYFCTLEDKKKDLVGQAFEKAKQILLNAGFVQDRMTTKIQPKKVSIALDILKEAESGYHLVVLGRKGTGGVKEFFLGSIPLKVFNHIKDASLLIVK
jgi:nucleotide-binding universal stress UspA family protein